MQKGEGIYSDTVVFTLITCRHMSVNVLTGAEPSGALLSLCDSEVEEAAMLLRIGL